jgi:1,4-alpha-glucan branching enzyme
MKRREFLQSMAVGTFSVLGNAAYGAWNLFAQDAGKSRSSAVSGERENAQRNTHDPIGIDNRDLIPKIVFDDRVLMEGTAPDWVKTLIIGEIRIETATPEGTFDSAIRVLDHYAEMGVSGLWVCPIYDRDNEMMNGYGNFGPQSIWPKLIGSKDTGESLLVVKRFIDEAHRRNIRIFLDITVWGTPKESPLVTLHPEFYTRKDGALEFVKDWGGYRFNWSNDALRLWFKDVAVNLIERTGADGFRVDTAPFASGYYFEEIRKELYGRGRKVVLLSEMPNTRRDVFDFAEGDVTGWTEDPDWLDDANLKEQERKFACSNLAAGGRMQNFLFRNNIVDVIREGRGIGSGKMQQEGTGGTFRFYTNNLLCHDDTEPFARGNRVRFAYATIFAPFIPMWWIGEEWNNAKVTEAALPLYFNPIDWGKINPNRAFYEDVKKYLRIRRSYPEIFETFPQSTRNANIVKVHTAKDGVPNALQAYARFATGKAILVVPNVEDVRARFEVEPDYSALGIRSSRHTIINLMTGQPIRKASSSRQHTSFNAEIESNELGLYLLSEE